MPDDPYPQPILAQILYSGMGGHGGVAFGILDADKPRRWRQSFGFLGVEPLLPAYRERCVGAGLPFGYIGSVQGRPWRSYRPLHRWLCKTRPDVVLLHSPPALLPCLAYCRAHGVPLIVVEHQNNALKSRQDWLFTWLSMRLANAVVLLTPGYATELRARLGRWFDARKVRVIGNGVNTVTFAGARSLARGRPVRIGMAARFTLTKRHDLLLALAARLRDRDGPGQFAFSLAGTGEAIENIRRAITERGLADTVTLEGMVSGVALADWYRSLDIYCHPTDGETLSVSVLQAMASGLPVVASAVPGISDLLDQKTGFLAPAQSVDAFEAMVDRVVADPDAARATGARARALANARYSTTAMIDGYRDLVDSLLPKRSRPRC